MPSELIVVVEDANREIRRLLADLYAADFVTHNAVLVPDVLQALSRKLECVAQRLASFPPSRPREEPSQAALGEYVGNLETLRRVLEKVQDSLARKRARLKRDFERINSARAWAEAYRATHNS